jgi:hypothetical protein
MTGVFAQEQATGSSLASWTELNIMLVLFAAAVVALFAFGRPGDPSWGAHRHVMRISDSLARLTRIPGWAAATIGLSMFGLLVAGQGFYTDVAWHVALGRDEELFTAPHTAIVVGLALIFSSAFAGVLFATLDRVDTRLRFKSLRIPWSTVPLFALGGAAVSGFPLDELWHNAYGVDVTMWSPTHMLMILGAALTGVAAWLVLFEAGVRPSTSRWAKGVHVVVAWLALQGLVAPLGEFSFGVPQFQQLFHPLLVSVAAGFGLVAIRIVLGRGWTFGIVAGSLLLTATGLLDFEGDSPARTREAAILIGSAVVVELVALLLGTARRARFAIAAGVGIGTAGLAVEWWWNSDAFQPWLADLLPEAVVLAVIGAVGAALVATAFVRPVSPDGATPPRWLVAGGGLAVLACIVVLLPRSTGDVVGAIQVRPAGEGLAHIDLTVEPADAADDVRWLQATSWQGGGFEVVDLERTGPGQFTTTEPLPVTGRWKTLVRLHRGGQMMALPVYLPADPDIDEPEVPAVDRTQAFESETTYLLRETHEGSSRWFSYVIHGLLALAVLTWAGAFIAAVRGIAQGTGPGTGAVTEPAPRPAGRARQRDPVGTPA